MSRYLSKYNIGERVIVKGAKNVPDTVIGSEAEIADIMHSEADRAPLYRLRMMKSGKTLNYIFKEEELKPFITRRTYRHELTYLDDVVVAILYDVTDDEKVEVARGHGHIIHEGALGIAQAAGYAMKLIHDKIKKKWGGGRLNDQRAAPRVRRAHA